MIPPPPKLQKNAAAAAISSDRPQLVLRGDHFDPVAANNKVVFNHGAIAEVIAATGDLLVANFTALPTPGVLTARVTTPAGSSEPTQVATIPAPPAWSSDDDRQFPWRAGYYRTTWPGEHTDLWRSGAVPDAGLPAAAFTDPTQKPTLTVATAALVTPVWGCTRDKDEVFVVGGSPFILEFFGKAIANSTHPTKPQITEARSRGAHLLSVPYIAKINPLTMEVTQLEMDQGKTINYTGGLLMHANGFVYAVAQSVLYKIDPDSMQVVESLQLPKVGTTAEEMFWTTYNGLQVIASGELVLKGFGYLDSSSMPGLLLLINPDTLAIVLQTSATVSSPRLTIEQSNDGPTYLYVITDLVSTRYLISSTAFVEDTAWTRSYNTVDSGSTQASSPLLFGKLGQIVFANNTAPSPTTPISMFAQSTSLEDLPPATAGLTAVPAFSESLPGYNFFMVAGDPFKSQLVVYYDPINRLLSAHRVSSSGSLETVWDRNNAYTISASPAVVTDRDLLYIDNFENGRDHLVVLRLSTGEELASVELAATLPTIGAIFVGMNEDVFILSNEAGSTQGLISRITVAPCQD